MHCTTDTLSLTARLHTEEHTSDVLSTSAFAVDQFESLSKRYHRLSSRSLAMVQM